MSWETQEAWGKKYHLRPRKAGMECIYPLFGKRCRAGYLDSRCEGCLYNNGHSWVDHARLWYSEFVKGGPVLATSEPYQCTEEELVDLLAFARKWGLTFFMHSWGGWHADTLMIELWNPFAYAAHSRFHDAKIKAEKA